MLCWDQCSHEEYFSSVLQSQNMGQKPRVSNKSKTWVWWLSIDVDSSTTLSLKQNSYWQTTCNGRKMPKKILIYVFFKTLWSPHVVQLSVNFWYLGLLVLGANLVLGSMLVGNHWSKVAPKLENSLLIFFSLALASQPFKKNAPNLDFLCGE